MTLLILAYLLATAAAPHPTPKETPVIMEDQDTKTPPIWVPAGKLSRRIDRPRPYGTVIPYSKESLEKEDAKEKAYNPPDEWEKISPWIYI